MTKSVEFFFDVGSPASYLAWTQLPKICKEEGGTLVYKPMLLGGVFQATGNASPAAVPAKGRYTNIDLQRFARRYGVALMPNPHFPIITLMLMRGAVGVQLLMRERFQDYLAGVFKAIWIDSLNLNDPALIAKAIQDAGFDPAQIHALTEDPGVKQALKNNTTEAVDRGAFGAPTIFIGDEMFFGQDRLDFVRQALQQR